MPEKYSFKCLEQDCANRVCCTREHVNVTLSDLTRWTAQGYLEHIIQGLSLRLPSKEDDSLIIETRRKPLAKIPETTSCIFYHEESRACSIRFGRPISCRTFPLYYNGEKFVVDDKTCSGIGKGEVTRDALKEQKDLAEQEYKETTETDAALPSVYALVMTHMIRESAEAMGRLSDDDRKKMEEIMSKREGPPSPDAPKVDEEDH